MIPVWLGVDPALGGGFSVTAVQPTAEKLYVLDNDIRYNLTETEEMIEGITTMARRYCAPQNPRAHVQYVIIEYDSQQKGLGNDRRLRAIAQMMGFEIVPHITRGTKLDEQYGVASMNQSFIKNEISIPWGDVDAQRRFGELVEQLRLWRPEVKTKNLRQDGPMSLWFPWRRWMQSRTVPRTAPEPSRRPSWMRAQPYKTLADLRTA